MYILTKPFDGLKLPSTMLTSGIIYASGSLGLVSVGAIVGRFLAQVQVAPIGNETPIAMGVVAAVVVGAFWTGVTVTGIKKDLLSVRNDGLENRKVLFWLLMNHPKTDDFPSDLRLKLGEK
jgi:hypothetical protein